MTAFYVEDNFRSEVVLSKIANHVHEHYVESRRLRLSSSLSLSDSIEDSEEEEEEDTENSSEQLQRDYHYAVGAEAQTRWDPADRTWATNLWEITGVERSTLLIRNTCKCSVVVLSQDGTLMRSIMPGQEVLIVPLDWPTVNRIWIAETGRHLFRYVQVDLRVPQKRKGIVVRSSHLRDTRGWFQPNGARKRELVLAGHQIAATRIQSIIRGFLVRKPTRCHHCWRVAMRCFVQDVVPSECDQRAMLRILPMLQEAGIVQNILQHEKLERNQDQAFLRPSYYKQHSTNNSKSAQFVWSALYYTAQAKELPQQSNHGVKPTKAQFCHLCLEKVIKEEIEVHQNLNIAFPCFHNTFMSQDLIHKLATKSCLDKTAEIQKRQNNAATRLQATWRMSVLRRRVVCLICAEEKPSGFMESHDHDNGADPCFCCKACWMQHIRVCVEDGRFQIRCPFYTSCGMPLQTEDIQHLAGSNLMQRFIMNRERNHAEYVSTLREGNADALFLSWANQYTRVCPQCSVIIYRFRGCDLMHCTCGYSFDWKAGPRLEAPLPEGTKQVLDNDPYVVERENNTISIPDHAQGNEQMWQASTSSLPKVRSYHGRKSPLRKFSRLRRWFAF
mmetsp:Transcript_4186/g.9083  ORF Transcript_4186/g.9083 Transcript_4186/m.9083 type:complete len:614 (+) Transcript_4186:487-2328(+)